ncbi:MAG: PilZ domain-containing protein [Myxococcales bacterium]|nr:PilZ domain-containing protein [Myxococcales bacterium]
MNTSAGYYQAPRQPRVPLDEVLIKLHPEGFHQEFEADGINVGAGGLSMRASVLPEVGSMLRCQLDDPAGGEAIEMIGRVVWAHESGPHVGEFGIRFTHLSDRDQTHIEALIQRWGRATAKAPLVQLQLDGVGSPIVAEVHSETGDGLCVEQPLPFLAIGASVLNESSGRRGHLEAVELKMDESTPKLVMSIGYELDGASTGSAGADGDRDTLPDEAPLKIHVRESGREERLHDTPRIVRYDREAEAAGKESLHDRLRAYATSATERVSNSFGNARSALSDGLVPRVTDNVRELFALAGRFIAALRSQLDDKPRRRQVPRSEAARAHLKNTRRNGRRYLILAGMICGIVAAGWAVYLWAAGTVNETDTEVETDTGTEADTEAHTETEAETRGETAGADATPSPAYLPQGAPLPPKSVRGTAFGADSVDGGEKYVLRMSNPVTELEGIIEADGFSITIPGSLSLSRAGPIAAAHPDVEHASILNRGDFSELTLRFVAGRHPAYRVEARGPAIEITVAR